MLIEQKLFELLECVAASLGAVAKEGARLAALDDNPAMKEIER